MGFSSAVVLLILCFACISQMRSAGLPKVMDLEFDVGRTVRAETFKLDITEGDTRFTEKIEIDKEKDIEYFKVPPHNGLPGTDNLFDFRMNITIRRLKKDRVCHITPLPPALPRPNELSQDLKAQSNLPPTHTIKKITKHWIVGDIVDKQTLRPEVQDFCGQFPIYRLEPFTPDSVSVVGDGQGETRTGRTRRAWEFYACDSNPFPDPRSCRFEDWLFTCKHSLHRFSTRLCRSVLSKSSQLISRSQSLNHLYFSLNISLLNAVKGNPIWH